MRKNSLVQLLLLVLTLLILSDTIASAPAATYTTTITEYSTTKIAETVVKTSVVTSVTTTTLTTMSPSTSTTYRLVPTPQMIVQVKTLILPMDPPKTIHQLTTMFVMIPTKVESEIVKTYTSEIVEGVTVTSSRFFTETTYSPRTLTKTHTSLYVKEEPTTQAPKTGAFSLVASPYSYLAIALVVIVIILAATFALRRRRRTAEPLGRKYFISCGKPVPLGAKYCEKCGAKQE